jgi:hypothetical protein
MTQQKSWWVNRATEGWFRLVLDPSISGRDVEASGSRGIVTLVTLAELTLVRSLPWLVIGLAGALVALFARGPIASAPLITTFTVHLSAMLVLVLTAALALVPLTSKWYLDSGLSLVGRLIASGASLTMLLTTGISAVAIASSAALGYRPSLSYLQLLSAADAGMVTAGTAVGLTWAFGPAVAAIAVELWSPLSASGRSGAIFMSSGSERKEAGRWTGRPSGAMCTPTTSRR